MGGLKKIDYFLEKIEEIAIAVALGIASLLNVFQVGARYLFNISFNTFDEISVYLMITVVFIGVVRADALRENISVDILHSFLSKTTAGMLYRISDGLLCAIAFSLAYFTADSVIFSKMIGETSVSSLGVMIWPIMTVMPISFCIVGIRSGLRSFEILDSHKAEQLGTGARI